MPEFLFRGRLVIEGASFVIEADTKEEAKAKARAGDYDDVHMDVGETTDWTIDPDTCEIDV